MMLHKLLQNIDRSRFQPMSISLMGKGEIGPRMETLCIPVRGLGVRSSLPNRLMVFRLAHLLRQLQPSLVHTLMYHANLLGGLAAWVAACRRVTWCLRQSNLSRKENKRSTLAVAGPCARLSWWLPVQILSCSQRAKTVHSAVGHMDEEIHVIPNGSDLSHFALDAVARASLRAGMGLPSDTSLAAWLRGPLRDWAEALLSEVRLKQEEYFHPVPIRQTWLEHGAGQRNNTAKLWSILMCQTWREKQGMATSGLGR